MIAAENTCSNGNGISDSKAHLTGNLNRKTWKEKSKSALKCIKNVLRETTVEPCLFVYMLCTAISSLAVQNMHLEKACRVNFDFGEDICDRISNRNTTDLESEMNQIHSLVAKVVAWKFPLQTSIPAVMVIFVGAWSDKYKKRKICILLPFIGEIFTNIGLLLATYYFKELPLTATALIEALPTALSGSYIIIFMGMFSFMADRTTVENRTFRLGLVTICVTLGTPTGTALSGILLRTLGYYGVFSLLLALYTFSFLYGLLKLEDIVSSDEVRKDGDASGSKCSKISREVLQMVANTVMVALKPRVMRGRTQIFCVLVLYLLMVGPLYDFKLEDLHTLEGAESVFENGSAKEDCLARYANVSDSFCPAYHDGILCWEPTQWHTYAIQRCFKELNGLLYDDTQHATRLCLDGVWHNYSDYTNCTERIANVAAPDVTSLIYIAGYSLSLAVLSLAVFVFLYFKDLRCLRNTIHTNLMSTYILSACSWLLNLVVQNYSDDAHKDNPSCMVLVICMHYFYLTNFFWILVEGLYLYMLVVETFTAENIKLQVYTTIGWGAPAVFVAIWVIARCCVTIVPGTSSDGMCKWMHEHQVDWIHKAPALAGMALNFFFLVRIMWVLITKLRSANTLETMQYRKATKALLVLIPLLGITYLLVLYGPDDDTWFAHAFDYTRALMLSTQGFTVALFYCFMNTEVRHAIRYHVERWKTGRTIGGGRRRGTSYSKDWSPRSRTESIRLYSHPSKRESAASETTTTTLLVPRMSLGPPLDGRHLHADYITSGSASGDQSPV